jgi:adenylate kinase family enzyme
MKVILVGNAGAGKSTLAGRLAERESSARLSLDQVAFLAGSVRRPRRESIADVEAFIDEHESWIIEGCYSDILEPVLKHAETLYLLNPGIETCVAHCRARPWEPGKFPSREEQDEHLEELIRWVRTYEKRIDEYGLARHRALLASFGGRKREFTDPGEYDSV